MTARRQSPRAPNLNRPPGWKTRPAALLACLPSFWLITPDLPGWARLPPAPVPPAPVPRTDEQSRYIAHAASTMTNLLFWRLEPLLVGNAMGISGHPDHGCPLMDCERLSGGVMAGPELSLFFVRGTTRDRRRMSCRQLKPRRSDSSLICPSPDLASGLRIEAVGPGRRGRMHRRHSAGTDPRMAAPPWTVGGRSPPPRGPTAQGLF